MRTWWPQIPVKVGTDWRAFLLVLSISVGPVWGADFRLKNGALVHGNKLVMSSLSSGAVGDAELKKVIDAVPDPRPIARLDTGWQFIYFPVMQQQEAIPAVPIPPPFRIPPTKRPGGRLTVTSLGTVTNIEPFDEYGRRRVTIVTPTKPLEVIQTINEIYPDHVMVESIQCDWKFGLSLKSIPVEIIEKLVRKQIKSDDPAARFALARFFMQAEYYQQAFDELAAIGRDFPDNKDMVEKSHADQTKLMNYFGGEILRRLGRRKRAGQHHLAETYAKMLIKQPLSGTVQQDVQQYLRSYEESRQAIERAKLLLSDWQAKLNDPEQEKRLHPLRSEINNQLDFETLPRLDAFLKAETDNQYQPSQRLGLAYSGWFLGSANAVPDLDQALRLADARQAVLEYLRTDDPSLEVELMKKLQSAENISPNTVLNLTAQLPPILDASEAQPGTAYHVQARSGEPFSYWVMLPAEYSPHHNYPLVVALRSRNLTTESTVEMWAGDKNTPDLGHQRGYIVIAPDYAERTATEYTFGAPAHKFVLDCLIDARKRFSVDSDRVYLAGHGMGGDAAFDIGMAHPDEFAGVIPVAGRAINYCNRLSENCAYTAWYVVGWGYDSNGTRDPAGNESIRVFDSILRGGVKFDFMLVDYMGRNGEGLSDEIPKIYDWMELASHVRRPQPKQFKVASLRKTDNRFFWITADRLPRDYILPAPAGDAQKIVPMELDVRATPGNTISLPALTDKYQLRLTPELVDFQKRVLVRIRDRIEFNNFVKPDTGVLLDELRLRGDRKRLPLAVISLGTGHRTSASSAAK